MENPDPRKIQSSGHESHGVHVCSKCGWPFPNPHPSARHRRAHKKICGTIDGYKLVDRENARSAASSSDDEHLSDDDYKTPCARTMDISNSWKSISGIGAISNRSEDEMFSDAVAEFPSSGLSPGSDTLEENGEPANDAKKVTESNPDALQSLKNTSATEQHGSSTESRETRNSEVSESLANFTGTTTEDRDQATNCIKESAAVSPDDKNGSAHDLCPVKSEILINPSEQLKVIGVTESTIDVGSERELEGNEYIKPCEKLTDVIIASVSENRQDTSNAVENAEIVQLQPEVESDNKLASKESTIGKSPEVECVESERVSVDSAIAKTDQAQEMGPTAPVVSTKDGHGTEVGNDSVLLLSVPDDIHGVENAKLLLEDFQAQEMGPTAPVVSTKNGRGTEVGNDSVLLLSVPDDIHGVENAKLLLEDFKDHKGINYQLVSMDQSATIKKLEGKTGLSANAERCTSVQSEQQSIGMEVFSPGMLTLEDKNDHPSKNDEAVVKESLVGGENISKIKQTLNEESEEQAAHASDYGSEMEKKEEIYSDVEHQSSKVDTSDAKPITAQTDAEVNETTNSVQTDDSVSHENDGIQINLPAGDDKMENLSEEYSADSMITSSEPSGNPGKSQVNPVPYVAEEHGASKFGNGTTERFENASQGHDAANYKKGTAEIENSRDALEKNRSMEIETTPESVVSHTENDKNFPETECRDFERVPGIPEVIKENEIDNNEKAWEDSAKAVTIAVESNYDRDLESLRKTSEIHMIKATQLPPLESESSMLSSAAAENTDKPGGGPGINSESAQTEDDACFVKHKDSTLAFTVSVGSSSPSDSLEANWGSVSVLSIQSDAPVAADAEKVNIKEPQAVSNGHHAKESEEFEPPSFMTLVEPRGDEGGSNTVASDSQTTQSPSEPSAASLQTSWFPSFNYVINDSPGRKKNGEIIEKITKWSTGKQQQHVPLKSLLNEARSPRQAKPPKAKETSSAPKVSSILGPETSTASSPSKGEVGEAWNSPVRYPVDIKREERTRKGRPFWLQFMCCSSVN